MKVIYLRNNMFQPLTGHYQVLISSALKIYEHLMMTHLGQKHVVPQIYDLNVNRSSVYIL
jgi:hypothetical protein